MKMGCYQRKHGKSVNDDVILINEIRKEKKFAYLEPKEKVYYLEDLDYNVLLLDIELEGWNST